jgi:hypothetical protein
VRNRILWLASVLTVAAGLVWAAVEELPDKKGEPPRASDDRSDFGGHFHPGPGRRGGPGGGFPHFGGFRPVAGIERALDDLNLADKTKKKAVAAVKAHQENVRKLMDLARADLLSNMKEVLSEEEFKNFQTGLDRPPSFGDRPIGPGGPPAKSVPAEVSRPEDLQWRPARLPNAPDNLSREIRR